MLSTVTQQTYKHAKRHESKISMCVNPETYKRFSLPATLNKIDQQ
jgi:hypothetical protein